MIMPVRSLPAVQWMSSGSDGRCRICDRMDRKDVVEPEAKMLRYAEVRSPEEYCLYRRASFLFNVRGIKGSRRA
jgi:hypothetical protein